MRAYQLERNTTSSHSFTIELPPDAPMGAAKIIMLFPDEQAAATPPPHFASLGEYTTWLKAQPPTGRTSADIEQHIRSERDSWE